MSYEINVAKKTKSPLTGEDSRPEHFFRVELQYDTEKAAREKYALFCAKFPQSEGYVITLSEWTKTGRTLANRDTWPKEGPRPMSEFFDEIENGPLK